MKMTQTAFVDSLVDCYSIQYKTQTPASAEFDLGPKRITRRGAWSVVDLSGMTRPDIATCGEGNDTTCPQFGRAALEGGLEENCLPEGNQGSEGCVPAGRGLETVVVR